MIEAKIHVAPGQRYLDNDPRMPGRVLTVWRALGQGVYAEDANARIRRYKRESFHTDGKPRKSGFSLIAGTAS